MGNLSNLYISQSFQSLIHLATNNTASATLIELEDGYGNPIGVSVNTAGDLSLLGSLTASLEKGYLWVGDGSNTTELISTQSFATTGSNNFTGSENISGSLSLVGPFIMSDKTNGNASSLVTRSGSIVFVGSGFTSGSSDLEHISSSGNFVNFFMKNNNITADTIISGSGNIFLNPAAPTAGFKRFMTGGNVSVGGTGAGVPQISGSMAWSPIIANNIFANSGTPITFRGPVSSSQSLLNNNIMAGGAVNLGTAAATNFEKATNGTTLINNIINGTVNATAYKTNFVGTSAMSLSQNTIGGAVTLNADSSSISLGNNTIQSTTTINNSYYNPSASAGGGILTVSANAIFGVGHTIYASGSNTATTTGRVAQSNLIAGSFISASVNLNGNNSNLYGVGIIGHGLSVTGSSILNIGAAAKQNSHGSMFVGRHNAQDGTRAMSAETIFAVGTGLSAAFPKTGFLIDSGSNTYVEGSLNVSGSTRLTGSVIVSGSTTLSGSLNVSGSITIQSGSGDLYVHGHKQFNCGAWQDSTTQSGSANTAHAFKFNTIDILDGVFLSGSTGLQAGAGGIYNIQWSGQLVQGASSADVIVWVRKNGIDVPNSGGTVTVASNNKLLPAWNYFLELNTNDVVELMWASTSNNTTWETIPATLYAPGCASIIATVSQVR